MSTKETSVNCATRKECYQRYDGDHSLQFNPQIPRTAFATFVRSFTSSSVVSDDKARSVTLAISFLLKDL